MNHIYRYGTTYIYVNCHELFRCHSRKKRTIDLVLRNTKLQSLETISNSKAWDSFAAKNRSEWRARLSEVPKWYLSDTCLRSFVVDIANPAPYHLARYPGYPAAIWPSAIKKECCKLVEACESERTKGGGPPT